MSYRRRLYVFWHPHCSINNHVYILSWMIQVGQHLLHLFMGGRIERTFTVDCMNGMSGPTLAGFSLFRFILQRVIFPRGIKFLSRVVMRFDMSNTLKSRENGYE